VARIRTIKPELFLSETVSSLSLEAERSFIGLLTQADDKGRMKESAPVLNGALWPCRPTHSVADMQQDIDEIVDKGLLCRYEHAGRKYLHFASWEEHQRISHPSTRNLAPPCPVHDTEDSNRRTKVSGVFPEASGKTRQGKERKGKELVNVPTLGTEGGPGGTENAQKAAPSSLPANAGGTKSNSRKRPTAHKSTKQSSSTQEEAGEEDIMGIYDEPVPAFEDLRDKGAVTKGKRVVGKNGISPKYLADAERVVEHLKGARKRIGASPRVTSSWWTETQSLLRGTGARDPFTADQICDIIDYAVADRFWHAHVTDPKGISRHGTKIYLSDEFVEWSVNSGRPAANRPRNNTLGPTRGSRGGGRRKVDPDRPASPEDYSENL
jgi:hypothetical protein